MTGKPISQRDYMRKLLVQFGSDGAMARASERHGDFTTTTFLVGFTARDRDQSTLAGELDVLDIRDMPTCPRET